MGKSVSRTIWINDDILEIKRNGASTAKWEVTALFKRIPRGTHYIVKYILDNHGPFLVMKRRIMVLINVRTKEDMGACFLPKTWDGKRVRRTVTAPIYEIEVNL